MSNVMEGQLLPSPLGHQGESVIGCGLGIASTVLVQTLTSASFGPVLVWLTDRAIILQSNHRSLHPYPPLWIYVWSDQYINGLHYTYAQQTLGWVEHNHNTRKESTTV